MNPEDLQMSEQDKARLDVLYKRIEKLTDEVKDIFAKYINE